MQLFSFFESWVVSSSLTEKNWLERRSIFAVMWYSVLPDLKTPFGEERKKKKERGIILHTRQALNKELNEAYKSEEFGKIIKEKVTKYNMSEVPVYSHAYNSSSLICCYFIFPAACF